MAFKTIRELAAIPAAENDLEITSDDFLMISNALQGGSTYKISVKQLNDVFPVFTPATATTIGTKGLVPAPDKGELDEYLTSSGDWEILPINERLKSGIVVAPENNSSVTSKDYANPYKSWSTDGEGNPAWRSWVDTIDVFTGPTATDPGKKGLVPAPAAGEGNEILRADGQWVLAGDMMSSSSVTVSATAPTGPKNGDLWFDTDSGSLFVYVEIASSWIEVSGGSSGSTFSVTTSVSTPSGSDGDLWFNETTGELYVYIDSVGWVQTNSGGGDGGSGGGGGGDGGSGSVLRKFSEHDAQTIKINCSTSEALAFVGPANYDGINFLSIVYAVGGSPRQHYTVMSFSGRTKKLKTTGGTYTLTSTNTSIGRENDAYGISAKYDSGILYIETSASSYTSSQFNGGTSDNNFMDTQFLVIDA